MDRQAKEATVAALHELFARGETVIVTHYAGLDANDATDLRRRMREAGAQFRVTKNRLTRLALKDTPHADLADLFTGPTAIGLSQDPVAPAKVLHEFADTHPQLVILGGGLGSQKLDQAAVSQLAKMPSLDELRAKLVGVISSPARSVAGVLQAPAGALARVFGAYSESEAA